jgi:hypothetical protein
MKEKEKKIGKLNGNKEKSTFKIGKIAWNNKF